MSYRDLEEVILELQGQEPLSSESQIEDFEKTTVYQDMQREWDLWVNDLRELFESGESKESPEYFRGAITVLKRVKATTGYLKSLINQEDSE